MFNNNERELLINKRYIDLECIGIDPILYYNITKYLNRCYTFIIKNDKTYIFNKSEFITNHDDIRINLMEVFGIHLDYTNKIFEEWKRDRLIYHNMIHNQTKYYDYLTLPI